MAVGSDQIRNGVMERGWGLGGLEGPEMKAKRSEIPGAKRVLGSLTTTILKRILKNEVRLERAELARDTTRRMS
jgi:hypothetical protein